MVKRVQCVRHSHPQNTADGCLHSSMLWSVLANTHDRLLQLIDGVKLLAVTNLLMRCPKWRNPPNWNQGCWRPHDRLNEGGNSRAAGTVCVSVASIVVRVYTVSSFFLLRTTVRITKNDLVFRFSCCRLQYEKRKTTSRTVFRISYLA